MHKLGDKGDRGAGRVVRSNYKIYLSLPAHILSILLMNSCNTDIFF